MTKIYYVEPGYFSGLKINKSFLKSPTEFSL